ncbi:MAG: hypothetical protein HKL91_09820 [Candidatus Eremiobacteraeota bacterium]|uniref:Gluconolactonase n=1 Tax=mine drainage metagenome TaxID=410659 RepID=E6PHQ9_9ZZZZ|nr:hypothetical protein [Candidatus Eremiobacteraeota bacterium]
MIEMQLIREIVRLPAPAPEPQALAADGERLWVSSMQTSRLYAVSPSDDRVLDEAQAPGKPIGAIALGDELRFVSSEGADDDRYLRRYVPGHGVKEHDRIACPEHTGSQLAFDGERLWLSQAVRKRLLALDAGGSILATMDFADAISGFARANVGCCFVEGTLYLLARNTDDATNTLVRVTSLEKCTVEALAHLPFRSVSLAHDGTRFWTADKPANALVAFTA